MGLDVMVFEKAVLIPFIHEHDEQCWDAGHVHTSPVQFPQSMRGLQPNRCYEVSGDEYSFRAGSYGGYNSFREALCQAALLVDPKTVWANPEKFNESPFFELINFSDCEGCIGPEAAADLAQDFKEQKERVYLKLDDYEQPRYDDWQKACELAANTGIIIFG